MSRRRFETKAVAMPGSRLSRLARLGGLASSIAGNVAAEAARRLARRASAIGRPVLTPANAMRAADELARMRGAAMKVGQLISMDAGDMLPPELAQIFDRLRSEARHMPWPQLRRVLTNAPDSVCAARAVSKASPDASAGRTIACEKPNLW